MIVDYRDSFLGLSTSTISQSSETYVPASVAEDVPGGSGSMAEPVVGRRVVLDRSRLYTFGRSAGEVSLSSARVPAGFRMVGGRLGWTS